jgi:hypothetical protein
LARATSEALGKVPIRYATGSSSVHTRLKLLPAE